MFILTHNLLVLVQKTSKQEDKCVRRLKLETLAGESSCHELLPGTLKESGRLAGRVLHLPELLAPHTKTNWFLLFRWMHMIL